MRNHSAKLNMQAMKVGEHAFFYHSNEGKEIVGIVEISKAYRPDPTDASGKFGMVDIRAVRPLPRPVTLEEVKGDKRLANMALVDQSRLSVQPVTAPNGRSFASLAAFIEAPSPARRRLLFILPSRAAHRAPERLATSIAVSSMIASPPIRSTCEIGTFVARRIDLGGKSCLGSDQP